MNCYFILGSAAEVIGRCTFLRVNSRLWVVQAVKQAMHISPNKQIDKKMQEDENTQDA